jgi:hypothetical protein
LSEKKPFLPTERLKFFNSIALYFQRLSICLLDNYSPKLTRPREMVSFSKAKDEVDSRKEKNMLKK